MNDNTNGNNRPTRAQRIIGTAIGYTIIAAALGVALSIAGGFIYLTGRIVGAW